jgi:hypothetical protein
MATLESVLGSKVLLSFDEIRVLVVVDVLHFGIGPNLVEHVEALAIVIGLGVGEHVLVGLVRV